MDEREADERYTRLVSNAAQARDLPRRPGQNHWATWMAAVHAELTARDTQGLTRLLGAYGGMGSFNDVAPATAGVRVGVSEWIDPKSGIGAVVHEVGVQPRRPVWEALELLGRGDSRLPSAAGATLNTCSAERT